MLKLLVVLQFFFFFIYLFVFVDEMPNQLYSYLQESFFSIFCRSFVRFFSDVKLHWQK